MVTKLNIGSGSRPLEGYINIDQDTLEDLRARYPNRTFSDDLRIEQHDIFNLPYDGNSVDEVRADGLIEHLSFKQEPLFLREVHRVVKTGGQFILSVPDFEATCKAWLELPDDWQDFYSDTDEAIRDQHWFGTYTYDYTNRWGYIMATFFGSQNGEGQYHKNAYTEAKLRKMLPAVGFKVEDVNQFRWQDTRDFMLSVSSMKT